MMMTPGSESDEAMARHLDDVRRRKAEATRKTLERMGKAFEERRKEAKRINAILSGQFKGYVDAALRAQFHPDTYAEMKLSSGIVYHNNVMRDLLGRRCVAWEQGAEYSLAFNGKPLEKGHDGAEQFSAAMSVFGYDALVARLDLLTEAHKAVFVLSEVTWCERIAKRAHQHLVLTPEHFDLIPSDDKAGDYKAVVIYWEEADDKASQNRIIWSTEEWVHERLGARGWEYVESGENKFRRIPGEVWRCKETPGQLWADSVGTQLADVTIDVNCAETLLAYMRPGQIKVLAGLFKNFPPGQRFAHARAPVNLGDAESFSVLDFQTDVNAFRDAFIKSPRREMALALGVPNDEDETTVPQSGEALKMRQHARDKYAQGKREDLKKLLVKQYWLDIQVLATEYAEPEPVGEHAGVVLPIDGFDGGWVYSEQTPTFTPPDPTTVLPPYEPGVHISRQPYVFMSDVREAEYPMLLAEQREQDKYDLEMGFVTYGELYARKNSDVPADQAEQQVRNKRLANAKLDREVARGAMSVGPQPGGGLLSLVSGRQQPPPPQQQQQPPPQDEQRRR